MARGGRRNPWAGVGVIVDTIAIEVVVAAIYDAVAVEVGTVPARRQTGVHVTADHVRYCVTWQSITRRALTRIPAAILRDIIGAPDQ